jgi:5-methylcytosine-specific restriction endonuclease McrA
VLFQPDAEKQRQIEEAWHQHRDRLLPRFSKNSLRDRLAEAQNWRCCWCYTAMEMDGCSPTAASIEHLIPTAVGGRHEIDNIAVACRRCNNSRPATPQERRRVLALLASE